MSTTCAEQISNRHRTGILVEMAWADAMEEAYDRD